MDQANEEAARRGDQTSGEAGSHTTGGTNPIEPQPRHIPGGLRTSLGSIVMIALIVAALILMIYQLTSD